MGKLMVICDSEKKYLEKLSAYFRKRKECIFDVVSFTDIDLMVKNLTGREVEILVISEKLLEECGSNITCDSVNEVIKISERNEPEKCLFIKKVIILSENKNGALPYREASNIAEECVYKYQAASGILYSILSEYDYKDLNENNETNVSIIGIYSPVKRSLKTSFAYTLSQILNEEENVLYLNLEGCSGLNAMLYFDNDKNLADLIFDYSIYREEYPKRFHKFIKTVDGIGIIPPVETVSELQCIDKEDLISMLRRLRYIDSYSKVVIDVGDNVSGIIDILCMCDVIYMPVRDDYISAAKMRTFETGLLKYDEGNSLFDKIRKIEFPLFNNLSDDLSSLKYGELGSYVRNVIAEGM